MHRMPQLGKLLAGIAKGLAHLHAQSPPIIHRDVRAANILLSSGKSSGDLRPVLGDWGLSRRASKQEAPEPRERQGRAAERKVGGNDKAAVSNPMFFLVVTLVKRHKYESCVYHPFSG